MILQNQLFLLDKYQTFASSSRETKPITRGHRLPTSNEKQQTFPVVAYSIIPGIPQFPNDPTFGCPRAHTDLFESLPKRFKLPQLFHIQLPPLQYSAHPIRPSPSNSFAQIPCAATGAPGRPRWYPCGPNSGFVSITFRLIIRVIVTAGRGSLCTSLARPGSLLLPRSCPGKTGDAATIEFNETKLRWYHPPTWRAIVSRCKCAPLPVDN